MAALNQAASLLANVLPILTPGVIFATVEHLFLPRAAHKFSMNLASPVLVFALAWVWVSFVTAYVPEPYLDEIFHIPQAQTYCRGQLLEWDDKITTPPGLYLLSIAAMRARILYAGDFCSPFMLRSFNVWATAAVALLASLCRRRIEALSSRGQEGSLISHYSIHTGFNIALFPLIFFFSGLYYTDVISTVSVLLAYAHHLNRVNSSTHSFMSDLAVVILGVLALFMRQTNVFWVVVYMGGLEVVHAVKRCSVAGNKYPRVSTTLTDRLREALQQYSTGHIHDPALNVCWPDDILFSLGSIAVAAICNPLQVLLQVWPHVATMGLFAGFVAWNGGVVLGDKSNHVATIHLAQMLYIWPLFALFSVPLFIPSIISAVNTLVSLPSHIHAVFAAKQHTQVKKTDSDDAEPRLGMVFALFAYRVYYVPYIVLTFLLSAVVVKFNTIVHPFTLADNRHYMFYIFRYTIRKSDTIRLALILPYSICRWLCWGALTSKSQSMLSFQTHEPTEFNNHPILKAPAPKSKVTKEKRANRTLGVSTISEDPASCGPTTASTAAILLIAATLSLVTAPLVEPRYFVIPWVMWRLLVPAWDMTELRLTPLSCVTRLPLVSRMVEFGGRYDVRLFVETLWFLVVNAVTMYIFIAKAYTWKAEDGTVLDGGRLQHFMW
ncbi:hypothetical protein BROUX41_004914 [Berkeleyomyces rouxiae]|uniref:uncharacterized protein n=1 Tax=Berkeleyomyces rouxiae TaxID=2035830 RepID=UPI003B7BC351